MKWLGLALLGVSLAGAGCGYRSDNLFRPGIRTVHVEMFESKEFRRGLEFRLTEAVQKRIGSDTPYRVASKASADTILRGEILEERQSSLAPDFVTRTPRDMNLVLVMRMEWKDVRSGEVLVERPLLLEAVDYLPPAGETEPFAQSKAIDRLAERIVMQMQTEDW